MRLLTVSLVFLLALTAAVAPGHSGAAALEYLYVNGNVGAAAGGHSAVRLGEDVFHYQFFPDERFLLVRDSWAHFRQVYNELLNRTIVSARIPLTQEAARRLTSSFTLTLATQQADLYRERRLQERIGLLNDLGAAFPSIAVAGFGFFDDQQGESAFGRDLRKYIEETLGHGFLGLQKNQDEQRVGALYHDLNGSVREPAKIVMLLDELSGLLKRQATLAVLLNGTGLSSDALLGTREMIGLDRRQEEALSVLLRGKMQTVARLLASPRPDNGEALLLEVARCHAIHRSLEQDRLFTLDPYPENSPAKVIDFSDRGVLSYLRRLREILQQRTVLMVNGLQEVSGTEGSLLYTIIETVHGRAAELSSALDTGRPVRLASEYMVPAARGAAALPSIHLASSVSAAARSLLDEDLAQQRSKISQRYSYHLITKNCVNELQRTVNRSFPGPEESEKLLGGWIDPVADRVFIPYDFFHKVTTHYRVEPVQVYPARRLAALAALPAGESGIEQWFREGNAITSTLYEPRQEDTPFLFFTDDIIWARPPLGLINLAWAALHAVGGVFFLPADGSENLWQGLRGMVYSLPELLFFNIRKGSYGYEDLSTRTKTL